MANWSHLPGCICVNCEDTRKFNDLAAKKERTDHRYTLHATYTGKGCAICGLHRDQHKAMDAEGGKS